MTPLVSICLPNLNTRPYLAERMDSIRAQTLGDWELIVCDSYSDDGSWEFFQQLAAKEGRMSLAQTPKDGIYPNWNRCVERARGKYIYFATSDDTMAPDCLEKMAAALERQPDCDLALCPLRTIDEHGRDVAAPKWPECSTFSDGAGELLLRPHTRRAPYDGLLHLLGNIIYNSITQLLIRRSLFGRIGGFSPNWGSVGDFNWEMKASLVTSTVYVPETWASWRVHPKQATALTALMSEDHFRKVDEMIADAFRTCEPLLAPPIARGLRERWIPWVHDIRVYYAGLRNRPDALARRAYQLRQLLSGSAAARSEVIGAFTGRPKWPENAPAHFRSWLASIGQAPAMVPAPPSLPGGPTGENRAAPLVFPAAPP